MKIKYYLILYFIISILVLILIPIHKSNLKLTLECMKDSKQKLLFYMYFINTIKECKILLIMLFLKTVILIL